MYIPTFRTKTNNVPILSRNELDSIGEHLVADFCPDAMVNPMEIDIDRFLTRYLGLEQDFQYLSHCGLYLGMTVFNNSDRVAVFNPEKWKAEYISVKAGTVLIDNSLLENNQEHRYRFTAAHEGAHKVLHSEYFIQLANKYLKDYIPMVQCRVDNTGTSRCSNYKKTDSDWLEWQANCLASSILMPKKMVIKAVRQAERRSLSVNAGMEAVIRTFNVSNDAAYYRIQELGLGFAQHKCAR